MAVFFDLNAPGDIALIFPVEYRKAADIQDVVDDVEEEVLEHFTRRVDATTAFYRHPDGVEIETGVYMCLRGYSAVSANVDAALARAIKRTIAICVSWRLQWNRRDHSVESQHTTEGKFVRFRDTAHEKFPQDWDRRLRNFSTLPPSGEYL